MRAAEEAIEGGVVVRSVGAESILGIVEVHNACFPKSALVKMGPEAVRRFYDWTILGPHESVALATFEGEKLVGFIVGGTFRGAHGGFVRKNRRFLAARVLMKPWLILDPLFRDRIALGLRILARGLRRRRAAPPPAGPRVYSLLSMGVHPDHRGVSALLLLSRSEQIARERGYDAVEAVIELDNKVIARMYEKLGYARFSENGAWKGCFRKSVQERAGSNQENGN